MHLLDSLRQRFHGLLPSPEALAHNRWLRWLGPALHHPRLWHVNRRGIALGCAIGVFFGLLIPVAQIPASAAFAVLLRANLPSAVASTLVTNPVTFGPVYYAAWWVGDHLLGGEGGGPPGQAKAEASPAATPTAPQPATAPQASGSRIADWAARTWAGIQGVGKALVLGLVLFAVVFGVGIYALIHLGWRLRIVIKRRRRMRMAA